MCGCVCSGILVVSGLQDKAATAQSVGLLDPLANSWSTLPCSGGGPSPTLAFHSASLLPLVHPHTYLVAGAEPDLSAANSVAVVFGGVRCGCEGVHASNACSRFVVWCGSDGTLNTWVTHRRSACSFPEGVGLATCHRHRAGTMPTLSIAGAIARPSTRPVCVCVGVCVGVCVCVRARLW